MKTYQTMTVREVLKTLLECSDLEAEVHMSIINSDPVPVIEAEENDDGLMVLNDEQTARSSAETEEDTSALEFKSTIGDIPPENTES